MLYFLDESPVSKGKGATFTTTFGGHCQITPFAQERFLVIFFLVPDRNLTHDKAKTQTLLTETVQSFEACLENIGIDLQSISELTETFMRSYCQFFIGSEPVICSSHSDQAGRVFKQLFLTFKAYKPVCQWIIYNKNGLQEMSRCPSISFTNKGNY